MTFEKFSPYLKLIFSVNLKSIMRLLFVINFLSRLVFEDNFHQYSMPAGWYWHFAAIAKNFLPQLILSGFCCSTLYCLIRIKTLFMSLSSPMTTIFSIIAAQGTFFNQFLALICSTAVLFVYEGICFANSFGHYLCFPFTILILTAGWKTRSTAFARLDSMALIVFLSASLIWRCWIVSGKSQTANSFRIFLDSFGHHFSAAFFESPGNSVIVSPARWTRQDGRPWITTWFYCTNFQTLLRFHHNYIL